MTEAKKKQRTFRSSEDRRAEIIEAAFQCIQDVGYAKLTARKIAEHSNISLGHITYHFKDMNEVLVETYRYASRTLLDATFQDVGRSSKTPIEQLKAFLGTGFSPAFLKHEYLRVRVDLWSAALSHAQIAETERELYDRYRLNLVEVLQKVREERQGSEGDVTLLADSIMAMLDGLWLDWERHHDDASIRNGLEGCIRLVNAVLPAEEHPVIQPMN
ncbi:TetR/AcrR family transcriptional regulator [Shinella sp.]|uniref:TetR/AcrR family transcriptional regulator n=1 Tax=Shinella sp. TaxID=1870904 RepID=UPI003F703162